MKCTNRISEKSLNFRLYRIIYEFPFHDAVYRRKDVKQMAELNKVSVDDLKVTGKRVLVRVDFNVPMKDGVIAEVRKREHYEKPSVKRKKKSEAARKRKY